MGKFDDISFYGHEDEELQKEYKRLFCNMTQEEKQLLIKEICARLPYRVKCCARYNTGSKYDTDIITILPENGTIVTRQNELHYQTSSLIEDCRPYLRPMSSMTENEEREFEETLQYTQYTLESYDWLNAHHFDYRGLIPMGLALEAKEGMYND